MAIIVSPTNLAMGDQCKISQRRYDAANTSDVTGSSQARIYGLPRWKMTLVCNEICSLDEGALWESIILKLRGRINHLQCFDYMKPLPRGTIQSGVVTVKTAIAKGDTTFVLAAGAGNAGKTFERADWLQFASGLGTSQLFKTVDPATANGLGDITINVEPPSRLAFAAGTVVTYIRPVTYYKGVSVPEWSYNYGGQTQEGFALDLLEQWF